MRFADTSFWIALVRRREQHHDTAVVLQRANRAPILTTNLVLGETWTFLNRRDGHDVAQRAVELIRASQRASVERVDERHEDEAWRWLARHDERAYSFVDATSFAVMRRRRISEALAFDGDFSAAGYVEVRP
jgi:predicted nucleic acid-binding protein